MGEIDPVEVEAALHGGVLVLQCVECGKQIRYVFKNPHVGEPLMIFADDAPCTNCSTADRPVVVPFAVLVGSQVEAIPEAPDDPEQTAPAPEAEAEAGAGEAVQLPENSAG
jgi:hypothetical protein